MISLCPKDGVHGNIVILGFQVIHHLEIVAQSQGGVIRLSGQEFIIEATTITHPVALGIKG